MTSEIVIGLQGIILLVLGIGVKGIIDIAVHLAKLNGKVHELELGDRHLEGELRDLKKDVAKEHEAIWGKVDTIDKRCIDVLRQGGK
jgi:hypothetical protein